MSAPHFLAPGPVHRATRLRDRLRGLLGRRSLPADEVLVIAPCSAIHTIGMRFAIDVAFLGRDHTILRIDRQVAPWRMRSCSSAHAVLEMAAGSADRMGLVVGRRWQGGVGR